MEREKDDGNIEYKSQLLDGNLEEYVLPFRHSDAINLKDKYIVTCNKSYEEYFKNRLVDINNLS